MISIITCSKREACLENVFKNYHYQNWEEKELIVILNKDSMNESRWKEKAKQYQNVTIYQLPEITTLGECLNFGIKKAKYPYIAKFDDDDYYGTNYLNDTMKSFKTTNADVVGKEAFYVYIKSQKALILMKERSENTFTQWIAGATWVCKKEVFENIQFKKINIAEDLNFYFQCRQQGFRIYSSNKGNFCAIRRENVGSHSWRIRNESLIKKGKLIAYCDDFIPYVNINA